MATLHNLLEIRSAEAAGAITWLHALADALDQTDLYFDKKPILASATAVDAFVYTKNLDREGDKREKKRWRQVLVPPKLRLGVRGAPGSGKTFLTRDSAVALARESARLIQARQIHLDDVPVPFWITAGALSATPIGDAEEMVVNASLLSITRSKNIPRAPRGWLVQAAASAKALVVVDALDELVAQQVEDFKLRCHRLRDLPGRLIATCRTMHWDELALWLGWSDLVEVEFAPFEQSEQLEFSRRFPPSSGALGLPQLLADNDPLRQACRSPLLLAFVCILQAKGKNLSRANWVTVYMEIIRQLLSGEWRNVTPQWAGDTVLQEEVLHFLESAAWVIFSEAPGANRFTLSQWKRAGAPPLKINILSELVRCGMLALADSDEFNDRSWSFLHLTLLEFLAARSLARQPEVIWLAEAKKHFWHEPDWIEVFTFLAAQVKDATPLLHSAVDSLLSAQATTVRLRIGQAILALHQIKPDLVRRALYFYFESAADAPALLMNEGSMRDVASFRDTIDRIKRDMTREKIDFVVIEGNQAFRPFDHIMSHLDRRDSTGDVCYLKIIVDSVRDCYAALGIVHRHFPPIAGYFEDFIAMPTATSITYQALFTSSEGCSGCFVHIVIRTHLMESYANQCEEKWFHDLLVRIEEKQDKLQLPIVPVAGLTHRTALLIHTPGDEITLLDEGATVLDLAYKIHSELGRTCIGAIVNGIPVSPDYRLSYDDLVEVLKDTAAHPDERWIEWAHLRSTRAKIEKYLRKGQNRSTKGKINLK